SVGVVQLPLTSAGACVVPRSCLGIHTELSHQTAAHIIPVEVSSDAELSHLEFVGPEDFARTTDGIVFWMVEVDDVIDVDSELAGENFRLQREILLTTVPGQPGKISK